MITRSSAMAGVSEATLFEALATCAGQPDVREEVLRNHDDNRWWPRGVEDWRLRMVLAGWSTRVSYNMISTYQSVVSQAVGIGYETLCRLGSDELCDLVGSLGLFRARNQYLRSLRSFIDTLDTDSEPLTLPNDILISRMAEEVKWASYKVAQCAVLYAKGYHCGVFPVDSGMKDMLGPCLGMQLPSGPIAHEIMRKRIEQLLNGSPNRTYDLARNTGYSALDLPADTAPTWWAHLVLIYFKRLYCNKRSPTLCPLRLNEKIGGFVGRMCDRVTPEPGR